MRILTSLSASMRRPCCRRAFTLIELLVVVAIIALLIGILLPSLGGARDSAKRVKSKASMKTIGDGLELFNGENEKELKGNNYPTSKAGDDPTKDVGGKELFGAQWAVRYLMGEDFKGYIPPSQAKAFEGATLGFEQEGWYEEPGTTNPNPKLADPNITLPRAGPYVTPDAIAIKAPKDLTTRLSPAVAATPEPRDVNPVFVDAFDMPILYYAANSRHASSAKSNIATTQLPNSGGTGGYQGIYNYGDNAYFTGGKVCGGVPPLCEDFDSDTALILGGDGTNLGPLTWGTTSNETAPVTASDWKNEIDENPGSFANYILDRTAFEASAGKTVVPVRRDSFILVSPGKDGLFGNKDDVKIFD